MIGKIRHRRVDALIRFLVANPELHQDPNVLNEAILKKWPSLTFAEALRAFGAVLEVLEAEAIEGLAKSPPKGTA